MDTGHVVLWVGAWSNFPLHMATDPTPTPQKVLDGKIKYSSSLPGSLWNYTHCFLWWEKSCLGEVGDLLATVWLYSPGALHAGWPHTFQTKPQVTQPKAGVEWEKNCLFFFPSFKILWFSEQFIACWQCFTGTDIFKLLILKTLAASPRRKLPPQFK